MRLGAAAGEVHVPAAHETYTLAAVPLAGTDEGAEARGRGVAKVGAAGAVVSAMDAHPNAAPLQQWACRWGGELPMGYS